MENKEDIEKNGSDKKFNFKEYIDKNPEYKVKHTKYVCAKIKCECNRMIARGNMANHKKTSVHLKLMNGEAKEDNDKLNKVLLELAELKNLINKK
jgi:hypothetical protein